MLPPMFAPAHQLDRQIHVINAYCREAEYMRDPLHHILWDLLDSLIDIHSQVAPKSLFAGRCTSGCFTLMLNVLLYIAGLKVCMTCLRILWQVCLLTSVNMFYKCQLLVVYTQ